MLILSHADGLGIDLHQLRKRVLKPPCDGHGGAQRHVKVRKFLRAQLGRGIHGRARLADHHVAHAGEIPQKLGNKDFRLLGSRAVADGDGGDVVAANHIRKRSRRFFLFVVRRGGVDHAGFEHLAGLVHHGQLAAGAVGRVEAQRHAAAQGRLHEKRLQVLREHANGLLVGAVGQLGANFAFQRREQEPRPCILNRVFQKFPIIAARNEHLRGDFGARFGFVHLDGDLQPFLLLAAVDGENAVALRQANRLGEVGILPVYAVALLRGAGAQRALAANQRLFARADGGVVREILGENVARAGKRVRGRFYALFGIDVCLRDLRKTAFPLQANQRREPFQPLFAGDGRARLALGTVGAINVLELGKRLRALYGARQLVRPFVLRLHGLGDFLPARVQPTQGRELLGKLAQRLVVGVPMHFLAIAGDKGNGRAAVEQLDHVLRVRGLHMILRCKRKCVFVHVVPPLYVFVRFNPL